MPTQMYEGRAILQTVSMPLGMHQALLARAHNQRESISKVVREALEKHLEEPADNKRKNNRK